MYKVFIENKSLIFSQFKPKGKNNLIIKSELIKNIDVDVLPLLLNNSENKEVIVFSKNIEEEFKRIFKEYDKVEAAGGIVRRKKKLLFIKRNGVWDLPKGKLEDDENIADGAVREIEEECGIKHPVVDQQIGITYHTYDYKGIPTIKKTYWFSLDYTGTKETVGQIEEGITKVKWFRSDELKKVRKNTYASIGEIIDTYLKDNE